MKQTVVVFACLLCSGVAAAGGVSGDCQVHAAYVLLGQAMSGKTVPMARVILDDSVKGCPNLVPLDGKGEGVAMTPRDNPDKKHFPVRVCEAIYPESRQMQIEGTSIALPEVTIGAAIKHVAVIGDTGCKPQSDTQAKSCGPDFWPFQALAEAVTADKPTPDLILHMGDYNYRGTPGKIHIKGQRKLKRVYDAGDNAPGVSCKLKGPYWGQNSKGSKNPDHWENWRLDFFQPAKRLLRTAPWVFARGNHELCSRAGPGWFYFLDSGSKLLGEGAKQLACPSAESKKPLVFHEPYRLDLGTLTLVVLDSANACDKGDLHQGHFNEQFSRIQSLLKKGPESETTWIQSHRPLWAVTKASDGAPCDKGGSTSEYSCIDRTLQTAFAKHPLPKPVHLLVSGHIHRFQSISFSPSGQAQRPAQLVLGNGGVSLAKNHPKKPFSFAIDGMTGVGFGLSQFGYMRISLGDKGSWTGQLVNPTLPCGKALLAQCDSTKPGICAPVTH